MLAPRLALCRRRAIFQLLLQWFGAMIGTMANGHQPRPATLWRVTLESWLRYQGLIVIHRYSEFNATILSGDSFALSL